MTRGRGTGSGAGGGARPDRGAGADWRGDEGARLAADVLSRLQSGKPLDDLSLPRDDRGRVDLRGFAFPPPRAVGRLSGRWGRAKVIDGTAEFRNVELRGLNLGGAAAASLRLHHCTVTDCSFDGADLRDLRLWDTAITRCTFEGARLQDAVIGSWDRGRRNTWHSVSFARTHLRGAVVLGAAFEACDFSGAKLDGVHFEQCALRECRFTGRLREVVFDGRPVPDRPLPTPLLRVDFSGAEFEDVEFWGCHFEDVTLPGTPGLYVVRGYRAAARHALDLLAGDTSPEARMLTAEFTEALRGPGDESADGLFNRGDYERAGGHQLASLAERVLGGREG